VNVTVFYAWQDDRPGKVNRYLIRDAAQAACDEITGDHSNDYTLTLDQDTAGQPGMCDIPNTILEKIRDCDIFLADMTFVGMSETKSIDEKTQLIPNPNVTLELGYAVGSKATKESDGFDRVIAVMNTSYGNPDEQMFDVKRRHPIRYNLSAGTTSAVQRVQESLTKDIKSALLTILDKVVVFQKGEIAAERFNGIRTKFESDVRNGQFHGLYHPSNTIAITLVPDVVRAVDYQAIDSANVPFWSRGGGTRERGGRSIRTVALARASMDSNAPSVRCSITEVTVEGIVLGADVITLCSQFHPSHAQQNIVPAIAFEEDIIITLYSYAKFLRELDIAMPWRVGISLLGVHGFEMTARPGFRDIPGPYKGKDVVADMVIVRNNDEVSSPKGVGRKLKNTFDYIWREFGHKCSMNYDNEGNWSPRR
jgi:hypothetical protein